MKKINDKQAKKVAGGDAAGASIISATTGTATAIGTAVGGPVGAIVGAAIGAGLGNLASEHKADIAKGLGQAADSVSKGYGQGHKDAHFTGMPMAFQKK